MAGKNVVYVVQYEDGGIPDDPRIFRTARAADKAYLDLAGEVLGKPYKTVRGAAYALMNWGGDNMIRYWKSEIE